MCINLDDIDSLNRTDVSKLKAFISRAKITKRAAFQKFDQNSPRIASFVASTNRTDLLTDENNTRWVIMNVVSFDWEKYTKEIDPHQIWAEAFHYYSENKDAGDLSKIEKEERDKRNLTKFLATTIEREALGKEFVRSEAHRMTSTEVLQHLQEHSRLKYSPAILQRELKRMFGEPSQTSFGGRKGRFYSIRPYIIHKNAAPDLALSAENAVVEGNDYMPF